MMRASGAAVDDMMAAGGVASRGVEGEGKGRGCEFEDRLGWDGLADNWMAFISKLEILSPSINDDHWDVG